MSNIGMTLKVDRQRLLNTLIDRLESEAFLGGMWLPIGSVTAQAEAIDMPSKAVIAEKSKRLAQAAKRMGQCCQCPLHEKRRNIVPGEGNPDAQIVFVGEAPGADEDAQGRPFVGRAGQLLTKIIEAMGLKREDVFICNILKCRPPDNRDPQASEITACIEYLHGQLAIIEPDIIVALGAYAARTLLETSTSIGQLRGRVHEYRPHPLAEPIKLIATYHPAYLCRNYSTDARRRVWEDMKRVLNETGLPIPKGKLKTAGA